MAAKWRTMDGRVLKVKDMDDSHLCNSILLLERRLVEEAERFNKDYIAVLKQKLNTLNQELENRGLPMPLVPIKSLDYRRKEINERTNRE